MREEEIKEGVRGDPGTEKNGATSELCTKREAVEMRKPVWLSISYGPGPKPNTLLLLYDCNSTAF